MFQLIALLLATAPLADSRDAAASRHDEDGWDVQVGQDGQIIVASVSYDSGASLIVQCNRGKIDVAIGGISTNDPSGVMLTRTYQDGRTEPAYWSVSSASSVLISSAPTRDARSFKLEPTLELDTFDDKDAPIRVRLDLPSQSGAIDRVLSACGRPLVDPRDLVPSANGFLLSRPRLSMPNSAFRKYTTIQVELSCLIANSRLSNCQSDFESPRDPVVGAATARMANGTRVDVSDQVGAEGRLVDIILTASGR